MHVEGQNTPAYDSNGYVTGPDRTGTIIDDMRSFLDFAQSQNILVIFVLWNGAVLENQNTINLFYDDAKLQSYIDNALKVISVIIWNRRIIIYQYYKIYYLTLSFVLCDDDSQWWLLWVTILLLQLGK